MLSVQLLTICTMGSMSNDQAGAAAVAGKDDNNVILVKYAQGCAGDWQQQLSAHLNARAFWEVKGMLCDLVSWPLSSCYCLHPDRPLPALRCCPSACRGCVCSRPRVKAPAVGGSDEATGPCSCCCRPSECAITIMRSIWSL